MIKPSTKPWRILICLDEEQYDETKPLTIFDPVDTWKKLRLTNYTLRELLVPVFVRGKQVYHSPCLQDICAYARQEMQTLWEEYKRLTKPRLRYGVSGCSSMSQSRL